LAAREQLLVENATKRSSAPRTKGKGLLIDVGNSLALIKATFPGLHNQSALVLFSRDIKLFHQLVKSWAANSEFGRGRGDLSAVPL